MEPPYELLGAAERAARKRWPDAHEIKALWTPASTRSEVVVEVRAEYRGRADVVILPPREIAAVMS